MRRLMVFVAVLHLLTVSGCSKKEGTGSAGAVVTEGSFAPQFSAPDLGGKVVRLADLKGNVVLVNFWATWCPPCKEEIPSMVRLNARMAGKPFQMLAISVDDDGKKAVDEYFRKSGHSLPVLLDSDQRIATTYGVAGVPRTFIVDRKGVVTRVVVGGTDWSAPAMVTYLAELCNR